MSRIWTSHVMCIYIFESWHTCKYTAPVRDQVYLRTYERVMAHTYKSRVTYMNEWCHIYIWMSHGTHMSTQRLYMIWYYLHTYEWTMAHICTNHVMYPISHVRYIYVWVIANMLTRQIRSRTRVHLYTLAHLCIHMYVHTYTYIYIWI